MGQIEIDPLLEAYAVPVTSATSSIDQRIMLADRMAEHSASIDVMADLEYERDELKEELDGLKRDLEDAEKRLTEANEDRDRAIKARVCAEAQIQRFEEATELTDTVNLIADRDRLERDLADAAREMKALRAEYDAFQTFVGKKAKKTLEAWKACRP